jgi:hypothetical protein
MSSKFACQFACWQACKLAGASARKTERQLALAHHPEVAVFRSIPEPRAGTRKQEFTLTAIVATHGGANVLHHG